MAFHDLASVKAAICYSSLVYTTQHICILSIPTITTLVLGMSIDKKDTQSSP